MWALSKPLVMLHEAFWDNKPAMSNLHEFRTPCWVLQQDTKLHKLELKPQKFIFIGFANNLCMYHYYNQHVCHIMTSWNIIFTPNNNESADDTLADPPMLEGEIIISRSFLWLQPPKWQILKPFPNQLQACLACLHQCWTLCQLCEL